MPLPSHHSNVWAGGSLLMPRTMLRGDGTYSKARDSSTAGGWGSRPSSTRCFSTPGCHASPTPPPPTRTQPPLERVGRRELADASHDAARRRHVLEGEVLVDGRRLVFASELKALFCDPGLRRELDPVALDENLALEYVPSPRSIVRGISKLPPAHTLEWWLGSGIHRLHRYWSPTLGEDGAASRGASL